jgi:3-hydroxyisobutyrate dehydrogenase
VTVLGTGIMGAGMARSLIRAGLHVSVWNRSPQRARPLGEQGARVAGDLVDAVSGADVVVTMLFDADAVAEVMERALAAVPPHAVWVQSSTVGLAGARQLAELASQYGCGYVDAPVLGSKGPADQGALVVLAGGPRELQPKVAPVFEAIGRKTVWVGERPDSGHRLKLALNSWVLSITAATGQAIVLARDLGVDPQLALDTLSGTPTDSPYAQLKGRMMIADEYPPAFGLAAAVKDAELIMEALREAGDEPALMQAVHHLMVTAAQAGYAGQDMAAVVHAFR